MRNAKAHKEPVRRRRVPAAVVAILSLGLVAVLLGAAGFAFRGDDKTPAKASGPSAFRVLDPKDGNLIVGQNEVRQLTGRCDGDGVCEYTAPATLPVVKVAAGVASIPLRAGVSTSWSVSVSPQDAGIDPTKVRIAATGNQLLLTAVPAGTYRVSLRGDKAAWQFDLEVLPGTKSHKSAKGARSAR